MDNMLLSSLYAVLLFLTTSSSMAIILETKSLLLFPPQLRRRRVINKISTSSTNTSSSSITSRGGGFAGHTHPSSSRSSCCTTTTTSKSTSSTGGRTTTSQRQVHRHQHCHYPSSSPQCRPLHGKPCNAAFISAGSGGRVKGIFQRQHSSHRQRHSAVMFLALHDDDAINTTGSNDANDPFVNVGAEQKYNILLPAHDDHDDDDHDDDGITRAKLDPWLMLPILMPIVAYNTFDSVVEAYSALYNMLSQQVNFQPVDGGVLQTKMISPTLNGIVLPTCSLLFSTLVSNTVGTLRNRLNDVKMCLTQEAGDIQSLLLLTEYYPDNLRQSSQNYLYRYCCRLIAESRDSYNHEKFEGSANTEMNMFLGMLHSSSMKDVFLDSNDCGGAASSDRSIITGGITDQNDNRNSTPKTMNGGVQMLLSTEIYSQSLNLVDRLNLTRLSRMTHLRSPYPWLHYTILIILSIAIIFSFLMQTSNDALLYLDEIQLKMLWTMLFGTLSLLGFVIYDLNGPFRGSYRVSTAIQHLLTIREQLKTAATTSS